MKKRIDNVVLLSLLLLAFILNLSRRTPGFYFGEISPAAVKNVKTVGLSESPFAASDRETKLSFERLKGGDSMYCTYFGILNVRSGPSADSDLVGRIGYGDEVRAFWKEDSGYIRIVYKTPGSDSFQEGYCLREALSETAPQDVRVYLPIHDFKQYDPRWGGISLGDSYETIASAGCTTTCLAMAYSYLEGAVTMPDAMEERLSYNSDGLLSFPGVYTKSTSSDYLTEAYGILQKKIPVLMGGKRDDGSPHWVLLVGYQGDGVHMRTEDFIIHDPASEERVLLSEFFAEFPNFNKIAYYSGS